MSPVFLSLLCQKYATKYGLCSLRIGYVLTKNGYALVRYISVLVGYVLVLYILTEIINLKVHDF